MQVKALILLITFLGQYLPLCSIVSDCCDVVNIEITYDMSAKDNSEKEWPTPSKDCGEKCHRLNLTNTILIPIISPSIADLNPVFNNSNYHYKGLDDDVHKQDILHPPIS